MERVIEIHDSADPIFNTFDDGDLIKIKSGNEEGVYMLTGKKLVRTEIAKPKNFRAENEQVKSYRSLLKNRW